MFNQGPRWDLKSMKAVTNNKMVCVPKSDTTYLQIGGNFFLEIDLF